MSKEPNEREYVKEEIRREFQLERMLFFIGFFPFSVSLVARPNNGTYLAIFIYFTVILLAKSAQLALHHYILVKRPQLRINADIHDELIRFKKSRLAITLLCITFVL